MVTNFLKDPLKYGLGKRTGYRREVDERSKQHILKAAIIVTRQYLVLMLFKN